MYNICNILLGILQKDEKQPEQETLQSGELQDTVKQGNIGRQMSGYPPKTICTSGTESTTQRCRMGDTEKPSWTTIFDMDFEKNTMLGTYLQQTNQHKLMMCFLMPVKPWVENISPTSTLQALTYSIS